MEGAGVCKEGHGQANRGGKVVRVGSVLHLGWCSAGLTSSSVNGSFFTPGLSWLHHLQQGGTTMAVGQGAGADFWGHDTASSSILWQAQRAQASCARA
jgi:hypothetical protein